MGTKSVSEFISKAGIDKSIDSKKLNLALFELALTHSSYSVDNEQGRLVNNERLEFYGDAVLKLACSKFLYNKFTNEREGVLSSYRAVLVSDALLLEYGKDISLLDYLKVANRPDLKTKKAIDTICACAFEAVLGAMFIQSAFETVYDFLEPFFIKYIDFVKDNMLKINSKAALQEYTQGVDKKLPEYRLIGEFGKEHEKIFKVEVKYNGKVVGCGAGNSKKQAEQAAAYDACINLGVINDG